MSKVTFRVRGKSDKNARIKLRLIINRQNVFEVNSGFEIHPKNWSIKSKLPINNSTESKRTTVKLKELDSFVLDELFKGRANNEAINREWLQGKVDSYWGKSKLNSSEENISEFLVDHIQRFIDLAHTRKVNGKSSLGLAKNTIKKYISFKNLITEYEKEISKRIKFSEIDKLFADKFINWLLHKNKYSMNHSGKQIAHLKTVCKDAMDYGISINPYVLKLKSFKESQEDRYIVTFSLDEIEKIRNKKMPSESLENAKKWMLIGFEIGQRGGDLLKLTKENITSKDDKGYVYMKLIQEKTRKQVSVVICHPHTIGLVENEFPYSISIQKLNDYIKEVCAIADIKEDTEGKKFDKDLKRKVWGVYPKYELITTHSFRRSFATNWYQILSTSILMGITGHTKESQFREYINVREDEEKGARAFADIVGRTYRKTVKSNKKKRV